MLARNIYNEIAKKCLSIQSYLKNLSVIELDVQTEYLKTQHVVYKLWKLKPSSIFYDIVKTQNNRKLNTCLTTSWDL